MTDHTMRTGRGRPGPAVSGAAALVLSSTALWPLFADGGWAPVVVAAVGGVALAGVLLRSVRVPLPLVALGQVLVVAVLATAVFTDSGVLGLLPGPAALEQLQLLLEGAGRQIREETVPVPASPELSVLLVLLVGAAAVVVDVLVAGVQAPASAGLVLLCLVAVPASLADELLPWWSFLLGAAALLLLLLADGARREPHAGLAAGPAGLRSPAVVAVIGLAVAASAVAGVAATAVGTQGRLVSRDGSGGVGLNAFTQLRGQLDQPDDIALFTVSGLAQPQYLRSLSLDQFVDDEGWVLSSVTADGPAGGDLGAGVTAAGTSVEMAVAPQRYADRWLPVAGTPLRVQAAPEQLSRYGYDTTATTLHTDESQPLPAYAVSSVVPSGSANELRAAEPPELGQLEAVDARYYGAAGIDPQVADLAAEVVGDAPTALDAATRLSLFFTDPANGFTYDLSTASDDSGGDSDSLVDFLTVGKRGFCEQFASSMAAMLRTLGLPSRVAVGFTATSGTVETREVRTSDAHAWVEVFFPTFGWVAFDPTPLTDGRGVVPEYVTEAAQDPAQVQQQEAAPVPVPVPEPPVPTPATPVPDDLGAAPTPADTAAAGSGSPWPRRGGLTLLGLAVLAAVAAPAVWRELRRRRRRRAGTADAAWAELMDLAADRGATHHVSESPRQLGRRMVTEHELDEHGAAAVWRIVLAVEDTWYGGGGGRDGAEAGQGPGTGAALQQAAGAFRRARPLPLHHRLLPRSLRRVHHRKREPITAGRSDA